VPREAALFRIHRETSERIWLKAQSLPPPAAEAV